MRVASVRAARRKLVKLFKTPKSKFYWYDFTVRGRRYRASTQETKAARAGKIAGLKLAAACREVIRWTARPRTCGSFRPCSWTGLSLPDWRAILSGITATAGGC